jgi:hypothetical protein
MKIIEAIPPFNESLKCHKIYIGVLVPNDPTLGDGGEPNESIVDQVCAVAALAVREYMESGAGQETSAVRPDSCHCPSVPGEDCKLTAAECERRTQMNRSAKHD